MALKVKESEKNGQSIFQTKQSIKGNLNENISQEVSDQLAIVGTLHTISAASSLSTRHPSRRNE